MHKSRKNLQRLFDKQLNKYGKYIWSTLVIHSDRVVCAHCSTILMCKQQFVVYNHLVRILYLIFGCEALLKLEPSHSLNLDKLWNNRHNDYDDGDDDYDESERGITSIWCARVDCIVYSHAIILCMFACKLKYNSNELSNHKRFTLQNWFENHHNQNGVYVLQYMHRGIWFLMIAAAAAAKTKQKILSQTHILLSLFESANTI